MDFLLIILGMFMLSFFFYMVFIQGIEKRITPDYLTLILILIFGGFLLMYGMYEMMSNYKKENEIIELKREISKIKLKKELKELKK